MTSKKTIKPTVKGKVEARTVTTKDEWGHERVVGGFGDVGGKKKPIVEVDFDEATYLGDEDDGCFFQVGKGKGGWFVSVAVDCNSSHFTETMVRDDGPYKTEAEAVEAGRGAAIEWCITNGVKFDDTDEGPGYNDQLEPDAQVSAEEAIASTIFHAENASTNEFLTEEECAQLGRDILKLVLGRFRPDLFITEKPEKIERS